MTTRNPPSTLSTQAYAARMLRMKADADFYESLDYDRTRYTEDVAVAARIFLVTVRNAVLSESVDIEPPSVGLPPRIANSEAPTKTLTKGSLQKRKSANGTVAPASPPSSATAAQPAPPHPHKAGSSVQASAPDRRKDASSAAPSEATGRGTKRPAPAPSAGVPSSGKNSSSTTPKHKKVKRGSSSASAPNQGSSGRDGTTSIAGSTGGNQAETVNGRSTHQGPHSSGGTVNNQIPAHADVACRVKEDGKASWILAKVSRYVAEAKKYEVTDSGDDEKIKTHLVFKKHIRVLPKKPFDFEHNARVLAVYPDTTVFYPATFKGRRGRNIHCLFDEEEDTKNPMKEVDARFVIHLESF